MGWTVMVTRCISIEAFTHKLPCLLCKRQAAGVVAGSGTSNFNGSRLSCSFTRAKHVDDQQVYDIDAGNKYHILMAKGSASSRGQ